MSERGTLDPTEPHPSAFDAKEYIASLGAEKLMRYRESYASCALADNRLAEICGETLHRMMHGQPVSDRYLLGLAWSLKSMEEKQQ